MFIRVSVVGIYKGGTKGKKNDGCCRIFIRAPLERPGMKQHDGTAEKRRKKKSYITSKSIRMLRAVIYTSM